MIMIFFVQEWEVISTLSEDLDKWIVDCRCFFSFLKKVAMMNT